jgi:RNA polymerase sigma-70 factor (ECF subfamily)
MTQEENELIQQAQRGDVSAFEMLTHRYDKNVLGIAYSFCKNNDDAKDIYQEVFLRVFKSLKKFEFRSEFSTWLFRITTNVCITYKSQKKRRSVASLDEEVEHLEGETRTLGDTISGDSETDSRAISSDIAFHIENALEKLSPQQKMVFSLKHYDGYKIKEIASVMNCTEGTVKNYLFTATQRMRLNLQNIL